MNLSRRGFLAGLLASGTLAWAGAIGFRPGPVETLGTWGDGAALATFTQFVEETGWGVDALINDTVKNTYKFRRVLDNPRWRPE